MNANSFVEAAQHGSKVHADSQRVRCLLDLRRASTSDSDADQRNLPHRRQRPPSATFTTAVAMRGLLLPFYFSMWNLIRLFGR